MSARDDRLFPHQDDIYDTLMRAHAGLAEADSHALNARLVLLMANHIGDAKALTDLIATARSYTDAGNRSL